LFVIGFGPDSHQPATPTASQETDRNEDAVGNDAELLISRCGRPDKDWATDYDDPRPPIPSRFISYNKAHLKFAYIPGAGSKAGDPPPYEWKLVGIVDTRTGKAVTAENLKATLEKRLPCSFPK